MNDQEREELQEKVEHIKDEIAQNHELREEILHVVQSVEDAEKALSTIIRDFPGKVVARSWIRSKQSMLHEANEDLSHYMAQLDAMNRFHDGTLLGLAAEAKLKEHNDAEQQKGN